MAFEFDVFLSHNSVDRKTVLRLARGLEQRGLRVWLDDQQIPAGASIPAAIEAGLAASRVLVLCMSEAAFGSDWARLESQTFRFRDPLNRELRFIPLRLDDAPVPGSLAQFKYIDHRDADALDRLAAACQPRDVASTRPTAEPSRLLSQTISLGHTDRLLGVAVTPGGRHAVTASDDRTARVWDLGTGQATCTLEGHTGRIWGVAVTPDGRRAVTASGDGTARVWDLGTGQATCTLEGHTNELNGVAVSPDGRHVITASDDRTARVWDLARLSWLA